MVCALLILFRISISDSCLICLFFSAQFVCCPLFMDDIIDGVKRQIKKKTVLFFRTGTQITNRRSYEGVYSYGSEHNWQIQTVRIDSISNQNIGMTKKRALEQLSEVISFWNPDGCIIMGDAQHPYRNHAEFGKIPVVYCDAIPEELSAGSNAVSIDSEAVANCAARELLTMGMESFAYVGHPRRYGWCKAREKCFRKTIEQNGKSFVSYRIPKSDTQLDEICRWIKALPKPTGIFAANDTVAEAIINACWICGISVPYDIAVVGADNDEIICENTAVAITSVTPDFRKAGQMAGELLDELMESPASSQIRYFGVSDVVRRESTRKVKVFDRMIMKSLEYIRRNACNKISVSDVINVMECSRRYADLRFSKVVGRTILQEIQRTKIVRVKELLRNSKQRLEVVSDICGFMSCDDMRRIFKKHEGCTPSIWRSKTMNKGQSIK